MATWKRFCLLLMVICLFCLGEKVDVSILSAPHLQAGTRIFHRSRKQRRFHRHLVPSAVVCPPKPVAESLQPLDLTSYYRTPASKFASNKRFPWGDVPQGHVTLGNIPLEIGGHVCLWGQVNAKRGLVFPEEIQGIEVNRTFSALYLYHCTFYDAPTGTPVSKMIWHYKDGTSYEREIQYGVHVRDWYQVPGEKDELEDSHSKKVWTGKNSLPVPGSSRPLQFFVTEFDNPHPEKEIRSIDFISSKGPCNSCLLAITTGPAGELKVESHVGRSSSIAPMPASPPFGPASMPRISSGPLRAINK